MISSSIATNTVAPIHSVGDLARSLAEETSEIEALLALLRDEQQALQARDIESVYTLAVAKNERLARLGTLSGARGRFLRANGYAQDNAGMQLYLERTPALPGAVSQIWRRLLANATQARHTNTVNGQLIAAQLRYVGGAIAVLQQATSHLACYGADGQTRAAPASRSLASA